MKVAISVVLAALSLALPTVGTGALQGPRLSLVDSDVPALRGLGFKPAERVRLQIAAGTRHAIRLATAGRSGAFTMSLGTLSPGDCVGFSVIATGSDGSRATFKRAPGMCAALAN